MEPQDRGARVVSCPSDILTLAGISNSPASDTASKSRGSRRRHFQPSGLGSGPGLEVARTLLQAKLDGQARVLETLTGGADTLLVHHEPRLLRFPAQGFVD